MKDSLGIDKTCENCEHNYEACLDDMKEECKANRYCHFFPTAMACREGYVNFKG